MERAQQTGSPGVSKWDIRHKIWDYMEANNLADFPRPVHHRIPNFKDAPRASARLPDLQEFQSARTVKVNPDAPQKNARFLALEARKALLVPTPRLRTGLFNRIIPPPGATKEMLRKCATSQGVRDYSVPVGLDSKVHVDLVVVGSVAVSEKGFRIGKGEGFADLEYAMMVSMGAVREDTVVVTAVHDCQVVEIQVHHAVHGFEGLAFPPEAAGPPSEGAFFEHELAGRVDGPVVALARPAQPFGQLDEAFVEREVVAHRVLPALVRAAEEREAALQELVDLAQRQALGRRALDSHDNQGDVGVRRLLRPSDARVGLLCFGAAAASSSAAAPAAAATAGGRGGGGRRRFHDCSQLLLLRLVGGCRHRKSLGLGRRRRRGSRGRSAQQSCGHRRLPFAAPSLKDWLLGGTGRGV
uniref:Methenyltetrahydrofolate synthase domain-containing protein n=1 Tax=Podarcis muralis TaxID=64176 RepID=A0A670J005_PODMU